MVQNKLHIVIFSYNRALQLDLTLRSIFENLHGSEKEVSVLYHYSSSHKGSYKQLVSEWGHTVDFIYRKANRNFRMNVFPFFFKYYRNIFRYAKYKKLRESDYKFKSQLESIIASSDAELTMFNTDDTIIYKTHIIEGKIFDIIRDNPTNASYRMYVGSNQMDFPVEIRSSNNLYNWNYLDPQMYRHWAYPFAVDATIYNTHALLKIIKPVLYNTPSNLEGFVCEYCRRSGTLCDGYSPITSVAVGLPLNKVQTENNNVHGAFDVGKLCKLFMEGYRMIFTKKHITYSAEAQEYIILTKGSSLYLYDEESEAPRYIDKE